MLTITSGNDRRVLVGLCLISSNSVTNTASVGRDVTLTVMHFTKERQFWSCEEKSLAWNVWQSVVDKRLVDKICCDIHDNKTNAKCKDNRQMTQKIHKEK